MTQYLQFLSLFWILCLQYSLSCCLYLIAIHLRFARLSWYFLNVPLQMLFVYWPTRGCSLTYGWAWTSHYLLRCTSCCWCGWIACLVLFFPTSKVEWITWLWWFSSTTVTIHFLIETNSAKMVCDYFYSTAAEVPLWSDAEITFSRQ